MSQENVEIVRRPYEAYGPGDIEGALAAIVVAVLRVHAKGRESGVEIERLDGAVWTMRNGKGISLDYYSSKAEALEAVGRRE
jgi:ketosteroid isomerase-like protein